MNVQKLKYIKYNLFLNDHFIYMIWFIIYLLY